MAKPLRRDQSAAHPSLQRSLDIEQEHAKRYERGISRTAMRDTLIDLAALAGYGSKRDIAEQIRTGELRYCRAHKAIDDCPSAQIMGFIEQYGGSNA